MIKDTTLICSSLNSKCLLSHHWHLKWNMNFYIKVDSLDSNFYIVILFYLSTNKDLFHNWIIGKNTLKNHICQTTIINCFIWRHSWHTKILDHTLIDSEFWDFQSYGAEDYILLGYDAISLGNQLMAFWGSLWRWGHQVASKCHELINQLPTDAAIYDRGTEFSGKVNCFRGKLT